MRKGEGTLGLGQGLVGTGNRWRSVVGGVPLPQLLMAGTEGPRGVHHVLYTADHLGPVVETVAGSSSWTSTYAMLHTLVCISV